MPEKGGNIQGQDGNRFALASLSIEMTQYEHCSDPEAIIGRFYIPGTPLHHTLIIHSKAVADKALYLGRKSGMELDLDFVYSAAMLHDIGIFRCDAQGIHCTGKLPYIAHGIEGSRLLDAQGLHRHALVCERHTGAGISLEQIIDNKLPLPPRPMIPLTPEEKLICYADKFFSKSRHDLTEEKPIEKIISQMEKFGANTLMRFMEMHEMFGRNV